MVSKCIISNSSTCNIYLIPVHPHPQENKMYLAIKILRNVIEKERLFGRSNYKNN